MFLALMYCFFFSSSMIVPCRMNVQNDKIHTFAKITYNKDFTDGFSKEKKAVTKNKRPNE